MYHSAVQGRHCWSHLIETQDFTTLFLNERPCILLAGNGLEV